jgi:hypothetical protein
MWLGLKRLAQANAQAPARAKQRRNAMASRRSYRRAAAMNTPASRMRDDRCVRRLSALLSQNCKPLGSIAALISPEATLNGALPSQPASTLKLASDRDRAGWHGS